MTIYTITIKEEIVHDAILLCICASHYNYVYDSIRNNNYNILLILKYRKEIQ